MQNTINQLANKDSGENGRKEYYIQKQVRLNSRRTRLKQARAKVYSNISFILLRAQKGSLTLVHTTLHFYDTANKLSYLWVIKIKQLSDDPCYDTLVILLEKDLKLSQWGLMDQNNTITAFLAGLFLLFFVFFQNFQKPSSFLSL